MKEQRIGCLEKDFPVPIKESNFYKVIFHTAGSMNLSISEFVLTYLLLSFMDISSMLPVEEITKGEPSGMAMFIY